MEGSGTGLGFDVMKVWSIVRRRWRLGAAVGVLASVITLAIALQQTPIYTATASMLIEPRQLNLVRTETFSTATPDSSSLDTTVQMFSSRVLAEEVADRLRLYEDPEFNGRLRADRGFFAPVLEFLDTFGVVIAPAPTPNFAAAVANPAARAAVVGRIMGNMRARRIGLTYVLGVSFSSTDPRKAALIANTLAETYIRQQGDVRTGAISQANSTLTDQLANLRADAERADGAVQQYRIANNLISSQGATMAEQQVSTLAQQIAVASAYLAETEAKLRAARQQMSRGGGGADITSALGSGTVSALRQQEAQAQRNLAELQSRYGERHPEVLKAQQQVSSISIQIDQEIRRIVSNLEAEVEVARGRADSLRASQGSARGELQANNRAQVGLAELERRAQASRSVYEAFLARAKETSAEEGISQAEARVVSPAEPPWAPTSPNTRLAGAFAIIFGIVCGLSVAMAAEFLDTGLRTGSDVESRLGFPYAGSLPIPEAGKRSKRGRMALAEPHNYLVDRPFSSFAEAFRSVRAFVMLANNQQPPVVLALTSALPHEGKSVGAFCLMRTMAQAGSRTVVVDCDLRRKSITRFLIDPPEKGLVELLEGSATLEEVLIRDDRTEGWIIPVANQPSEALDLFSTSRMDALLTRLRDSFDFVILDTPATLAVAEARIIAAKADQVLFLTQWVRTPYRAAQAALDVLVEAGARVCGVALSQTDLKSQAESGYGDSAYYYKSYSSYYTN